MREPIIFVTDDKWLIQPGGLLDPDDQKILDQARQAGDLKIMNLEDANKYMETIDPADITAEPEGTTLPEGIMAVTPDMLKDITRNATNASGMCTIYFSALITLVEAAQIRFWRIHERRTWRSVARCAYEYWPYWPNRWYPPSNQVIGSELCKAAAKVFKENFLQDPWN